jgi:hypothetical protein
MARPSLFLITARARLDGIVVANLGWSDYGQEYEHVIQ